MKSLGKGLLIVVLMMSLAAMARADHFSDNFSVLNQTSLDALTKDMGIALAGGSFHTGKALGFPLGFDVGVHASSAKVNDDNAVLRDNGSNLMSQWIQAEVGLPFRLNVIGRVGKIQDANAYGGGLRVGIFKSNIPAMPSISLTGLYNQATHDYFDAKTVSGNLVLSFQVPFIHPYIGAGFDRTNVETTNKAPAPTRNMNSTQNGTRVEAGINLSFLPFLYITAGAGVANSQALYHLGAGVQF